MMQETIRPEDNQDTDFLGRKCYSEFLISTLNPIMTKEEYAHD